MERPEILAGIGVWYEKPAFSFSVQRSNISETGQDRTKVTILFEYEAAHALSIGAQING